MRVESKREFRAMPVHTSAASSVERYLGERASPERQDKGSNFRVVEGVQRLWGPISALHRSGDIDDCHVVAADRWYRDFVLGVEGARDPEARRSGKAGDIHAGMLSRVAACERHREVREALGFCGEIRLHLMLVEELSFSSIADKLLPGDVNGRKKVAAQMVFLLEQLVEHYASLDQRRRKVRAAAPEC